MKVGYLGLGAMGGSLAPHLIGKYDLTVYDRSPAAVERLVALGARAADSAAALARDCDVIVLCLPRTADVQDALFQPGGVDEGLSAGKLVIDQTSGVPGQTAAIAEKLRAKGVHFVDAPVSGGIPPAKAGNVTVIASGPDDAWAIAQPVLSGLSTKVFRCGTRVGDGQALKLCNNAVSGSMRMATLEIAGLAGKLGLPLETLVERLNGGKGGNYTSRLMLAARVKGAASTDFALALMIKDMNEAMALADAGGVPMPIAAAARALMQMGQNTRGPEARLEDMIPVTETLEGTRIAASTAIEGFTPASPNEAGALLAAVETAIEVCNLLTTCECLALAARYGLDVQTVGRIFLAGSAWTDAGGRLVDAIGAGGALQGFGTLGEMTAALRTLVSHGAKTCNPLVLPNNALADCLAALNEFGADAGAEALVTLKERAAGTRLRG